MRLLSFSLFSSQGVFWGLIIGFAFGIIRFILEFSYQAPICGESDQRPAFIRYAVGNFHYLHYGAFLFVITGLITIIVSLRDKTRITDENIARLTYWRRFSTLKRIPFDSGIVCLNTIIGLYIYNFPQLDSPL